MPVVGVAVCQDDHADLAALVKVRLRGGARVTTATRIATADTACNSTAARMTAADCCTGVPATLADGGNQAVPFSAVPEFGSNDVSRIVLSATGYLPAGVGSRQ